MEEPQNDHWSIDDFIRHMYDGVPYLGEIEDSFVSGWRDPKLYNETAHGTYHLDEDWYEPADHCLPGGTIVNFPISQEILDEDIEKFRQHKKDGTRIVATTFISVCTPSEARARGYMTREELHAPVYPPMTDDEIDALVAKTYKNYGHYLTRQKLKEQRQKNIKRIKDKIAKKLEPIKRIIKKKQEDFWLKSFLRRQK